MAERAVPTLWVVSADSWTREEVRLALDEDSGWHPRFFPAPDHVPSTEGLPTLVALFTHVSLADDLALVYGHIPLLGYGTPEQLTGLSLDCCTDVLVEPWGRVELLFRLGRLHAVGTARLGAGTLSWGRYWIEAERYDGPIRRVSVSAQHYALFDTLVRSQARPASRLTLLTAAGGVGMEGRALDMQVSRLRQILAEITVDWDPAPRIRAYRGRGYRLEDR